MKLAGHLRQLQLLLDRNLLFLRHYYTPDRFRLSVVVRLFLVIRYKGCLPFLLIVSYVFLFGGFLKIYLAFFVTVDMIG